MSPYEPDTPRAPGAYADLRAFRIFQHVPDSKLSKLAMLAKEQLVGAGQVVYDQGSSGDDFFVVLGGTVEGHRSTPTGRQPVTRVRVGQIFGEVSFLDSNPRDITAIAAGGTAMLCFNGTKVHRAIGADHELGVSLMRAFWHSLAAKIRQANLFLGDKMPLGSEEAETPTAAQGRAADVKPGAKLDLFAEKGLSAAELRLLATTLPAQSFEGGATLFVEGAPGNCLYIVMDGEVRISRRVPGRGETPLATLGRGEVFGEMAVVDDQLRSADASAGAGGTTVLALSRHDLDEVLQRPSDAASQFLQLMCRVLCHRIRGMTNLLVTRP
ncbi:MAG TPA: cyclic nucleotide-binding domain-containing protein [Thermoanaerobaculaceae bacterium]|nr:cyclic nucleotide-binding domain-containing protein [Thermoanaerobaculaceae bacterium]